MEAMTIGVHPQASPCMREDEFMKCPQCNSAMKTRRENYRYAASGLSGVTLMKVEVSRCLKCGEYVVAIPRIEQLHRALATFLSQKRSSFTGAEVNFLRKFLGWSGADFARHIGVTPETVSRWENDKEVMSPPADRALRLMVATRRPVTEYPLESLRNIARKPKLTRVGLTATSDEWEAVAV